MNLIAPPILVTVDDSGSATLTKGHSRVRLPSAEVSRICLDLLEAFRAPGVDPEVFVARFSPQVAPGIRDLVAQMRAGGFLVPEGTPLHLPESVFWSDFGQSHATIAEATAQLDVTLVGCNALGARVAMGLETAGIVAARRVHDPDLRGPGWNDLLQSDWQSSDGFTLPAASDGTARLVIACTDIGAETHLRPWNAFCVENRVDFLPVSIKDNRIVVGPYVRPFQNGCFECARGRVNANAIRMNRDDEAERPTRPEAFGWHPVLLDTAAAQVVTEVLRQTLGALPPLTPGMIVADPMGTGATSRHPVLRLPRCPVCSPLRHHTTPMVVDSEDRDSQLLEAFK